ncbi:MAG: hypothetical protein FJ126_13005 [Deltaproteobacteria bacterium]|nr:hypothetical protein [Deltaproteobacteria bacterium]
MSAAFPANAREAVITFHYADRIKAQILLASRLIVPLSQLQGEAREGGRVIFLEFLKGLEQEINLAQVQIAAPDMVRIRTVMTGLLGMADAGMFLDLQQHFTWMITVMATYAQRAMEFLVKEKLI